MKKLIALIVLIVMATILCGCNGCNRSCIDGIYNFDEAVIRMPDGEIIKGKVQSWHDYQDGDQIQVKINGTWYLVHSVNITLIAGE